MDPSSSRSRRTSLSFFFSSEPFLNMMKVTTAVLVGHTQLVFIHLLYMFYCTKNVCLLIKSLTFKTRKDTVPLFSHCSAKLQVCSNLLFVPLFCVVASVKLRWPADKEPWSAVMEWRRGRKLAACPNFSRRMCLNPAHEHENEQMKVWEKQVFIKLELKKKTIREALPDICDSTTCNK